MVRSMAYARLQTPMPFFSEYAPFASLDYIHCYAFRHPSRERHCDGNMSCSKTQYMTVQDLNQDHSNQSQVTEGLAQHNYLHTGSFGLGGRGVVTSSQFPLLMKVL